MKKIICVLLLVCIFCSFCACDPDGENQPPESSSTPIASPLTQPEVSENPVLPTASSVPPTKAPAEENTEMPQNPQTTYGTDPASWCGEAPSEPPKNSDTTR